MSSKIPELRGDYALELLDPADFCTRGEALEILGRGYDTLYRRINRGELRPIKFAGRTFFRREEVERMAERQGFIYGRLPREEVSA
jgi:hypothetical protein